MTESAQQSQPITPEAEANPKEGSQLPLSSDQEDSVEVFNKPAALPHFQIFVAFVEKYLGEKIKLFNRLREAKQESVAFEDLWMLFDSRDTIYCPLREVARDGLANTVDINAPKPVRRYTPQAYRVTLSVGGSLLYSFLSSPGEAKILDVSIDPTGDNLPITSVVTPLVPISTRIRSSYSELDVYCFYIDFDGLSYGMVRELFNFKPYDGELDIRSLQAYPIQYATNHTLSNRGKTFLQLTRVSHKQYEGLNAGSNRGEINSPVIVDIKLAFEADHDFEKRPIDAPKFNTHEEICRGRPFYGVYDVVSKPSCSNPWCYDRSCVENAYTGMVVNEQAAIATETRLVLEEYNISKQRGSAERRRFRDRMESNDLVRLLPGTVPGFALRNRKWGK